MRRGDEEVWVRQAPERPVAFESFQTELVEENQLSVIWRVGQETELGQDARWSNDEGATWHLLAIGLRGGEGV